MRKNIQLDATNKDIDKAIIANGNYEAIQYWKTIIINKINHKELNNNREDIMYWLIGVADGWIKL